MNHYLDPAGPYLNALGSWLDGARLYLEKNYPGLTLAYPQALYLLLGVALVLAWSLFGARRIRGILAPLLRALALTLLVLALSGPRQVLRTVGTTRPAVVDLSASITPAMRQWTANLLRAQLRLRDDDPALLFAGATLTETIGGALSALNSKGGCAPCKEGATDLETALKKAAAQPAGQKGPVVLVTDGWENQGEATRALGALRGAQVRLFIFTPPGAASVPDVAVVGLEMPPALAKAEPFAIGVTLRNLNARPVAGTVEVFQNDKLLTTREVTVPSGEQRFDFPISSAAAGLSSYRAVFRPASPADDAYPDDNALTGWVGVGAARKVLILTDSARDANYLETVVRRMGLEPEVVTVASAQYSGTLGAFKGYEAVILNNAPRARLALQTQVALADYVKGGGSLAMVGGDSSFGLGGWQDSVLAGVMPVTMKPPERKEQTRAIVLIIDKSGSMGRNQKLVYAKAAAETVAKTLNDDDMVAVVGFDSQPFVVVPLQPLKQSRPYLDEMINRLIARGTTFLLPALEEAARMLSSSKATIKHVVILTDGETGGTAAMYYDLVSSLHREAGVTISAVAIGDKANVALLQAISRYGGGAYFQTDNPQTLPQLVLEDSKKHGGSTTMVEKEFVPHSLRPDPVLKNLAGRELPALRGYVSTALKAGATMNMFVNRGGLREPVVASWKYGAGKALAVTTDASGRWSGPWVSGNAFALVWSRLVDWMTPQTATEQKFDVALGYSDGRIRVRLTDYEVRAGAAPLLVNLVVTGPDGGKSQQTLAEDLPGELSGSIEAPRPGTYNIELKSADNANRVFPPLAYTVSPAVNAEVPRPAPNYGLLEHLASDTGGRLNPELAEIGLTRAESERTVSLSPYLLIAAMILVVLESLVRRLTY